MTSTRDKNPRAFRYTRSALIRGLGLVYVSAFGSLAVQVDGLFGSRGILPAREYFNEVGNVLGPGLSRYRFLPSLLWINGSDGMLHLLCWGGMLMAAAVVAGLLPGPLLVLLWLFYLSLTTAGQVFLGYQWDALLLEAGFLAILLAPWGLWLHQARDEPWRPTIWLFRWLVFRLMFLSGVVKLASGDASWRSWTALTYHYQTQPLPTWTSWYVHQLPARFHWLSVGFLFYAELIAPFFIFGPRLVRLAGFVSLVLLQTLIAATGNYGFFNLLTVILCLSLLDDRDWNGLKSCWTRLRRRRPGGTILTEPVPHRVWPLGRRIVVASIGTVLVVATFGLVVEAVWREAPVPGEVVMVQNWLAPLRIVNSYGLFAVMTTRRSEITVEGSDDGETWKPYRFRWKPGELDHRPRFAPWHLPRLDWQMWFAALRGNCLREAWFLRFEDRLLEGSPEVLALLRDNPFPARPPLFIRARLEGYQFT
ncbi:MAG: lipase maturation factor family protein, partial [Isosphaeraceae bacterium]